jgi:hypothetical protein
MKLYDLKRERRLAWKKHQHELKRAELRKEQRTRSTVIKIESKQWSKKELERLKGLDARKAANDATNDAIREQRRAKREEARKATIEETKGLKDE